MFFFFNEEGDTVEFNKTVCIIYTLAKEREVRIGDLESAAGMSPGYLSRLNKKDSSTNPGIDALVVIAQKLGVTLDVLVGIDIDSLTATEAYFLQVVQKLQSDTNMDTIQWKCERMSELNDPSNRDLKKHPLVSSCYDDEIDEHYVAYRKATPSDSWASIAGNFYVTDINLVAQLYVTDVSYKDEREHVHEIFLFNRVKNELTPLCSTLNIREELAEQIDKLYSAIERAQNRPAISASAKLVLDAYLNGLMNNEEVDTSTPMPALSDEEIPF